MNRNMYQDLARKGLRGYDPKKVKFTPTGLSAEERELRRLAERYRAQAHTLETEAAMIHGGGARPNQLRREAAIARAMAADYDEQADNISHYGKKGMKWGVRKDKPKAAGAKGGEGKLSRKARKMSDEELRSHVKRLELEKKFTNLSMEKNKRNKTLGEKGRAEMRKILKEAARESIKKETSRQMSIALTKAIKKATQEDR